MKIGFISDTHMFHGAFDLPVCDVLVIAGDMLSGGSRKEIELFVSWLTFIAPRYQKVLVVAGNHDMCLEPMGKAKIREEIFTQENVHYLEDDSITIDGLVFYGSPWTPKFFDWSFMLMSEEHARKVWSNIPDKVDVLITHGPPRGILDMTPRGEQVGCMALLQRVMEVKPRIHAFGHIHLGGGKTETVNGIIFINAAICTERYQPFNKPVVLEIENEHTDREE